MSVTLVKVPVRIKNGQILRISTQFKIKKSTHPEIKKDTIITLSSIYKAISDGYEITIHEKKALS